METRSAHHWWWTGCMRSETDTGSVNCPEMVQRPQTRLSGALLRRNGVESGPALLDFLAAAVRAEDFPFFVVDKGQDLGEEFLAIVAKEFVAGHTQPPRRRVNGRILEPGTDEHNMV